MGRSIRFVKDVLQQGESVMVMRLQKRQIHLLEKQLLGRLLEVIGAHHRAWTRIPWSNTSFIYFEQSRLLNFLVTFRQISGKEESFKQARWSRPSGMRLLQLLPYTRIMSTGNRARFPIPQCKHLLSDNTQRQLVTCTY